MARWVAHARLIELAGGKTYGIRVTATTADGRHTPVGSSSFQTPAAAVAASAPSTAFTKYYYMALFGLMVAGFVMLCCSCRGDGR